MRYYAVLVLSLCWSSLIYVSAKMCRKPHIPHRVFFPAVPDSFPARLRYEGRLARISIIRRSNAVYDGSYQKSFNAIKLVAELAWDSGVDWLRVVRSGVLSDGREQFYLEVAVVADRCGGHLDLAFLIDGSGSLTTGTGSGTSELFEKELQFVRDLTSFFEIGPDRTRVSIATFHGPRVSNLSCVSAATSTPPRPGGGAGRR